MFSGFATIDIVGQHPSTNRKKTVSLPIKTEALLSVSSAEKEPYYRNFLREEIARGAARRTADIRRFGLAAKMLNVPEATLRDIRFHTEDRRSSDGRLIPGNGFAPAFLKLGRALYVDLAIFTDIWRAQQSEGLPVADRKQGTSGEEAVSMVAEVLK